MRQETSRNQIKQTSSNPHLAVRALVEDAPTVTILIGLGLQLKHCADLAVSACYEGEIRSLPPTGHRGRRWSFHGTRKEASAMVIPELPTSDGDSRGAVDLAADGGSKLRVGTSLEKWGNFGRLGI